MQKKYTLGAVLGIVAASFSALLLIGAIYVWIMASMDSRVQMAFAFSSMRGGIDQGTFSLTMALTSAFFAIGIWVNIHGAYRLSGRAKGSPALSIVLGVINSIGALVWIAGIVMYIIGIVNSYHMSDDEIVIAVVVILFYLLADFCLETVAVSLFRMARDCNQSSYGDPSNTFYRQMYNSIPQPTPQPFVDPAPQPAPQSFVNPNPQPAPQPFVDPNPQPAPQPFVNPNPQPAPQPIVDPAPQPAPQPFIDPAPKMGRVRVTEGVSMGQGYKLQPGYKIIVGKNAQSANLVINNPHVSNVHCSIRYNPVMNTYIVKDYSSNGTYVNNQRLPKETPVEYPAGTVLSLADGTSKITLG